MAKHIKTAEELFDKMFGKPNASDMKLVDGFNNRYVSVILEKYVNPAKEAESHGDIEKAKELYKLASQEFAGHGASEEAGDYAAKAGDLEGAKKFYENAIRKYESEDWDSGVKKVKEKMKRLNL